MSEEYGFEVHAMPHLHDENDERYSSSRVRNLLLEGDMVGAAEVLGRAFSVHVALYEDDQLNLVASIQRYSAIKNGVYWAKIVYDDNPSGAVIPVRVKDGKVLISPLPNLPDIPEGRAELHFVDSLD